MSSCLLFSWLDPCLFTIVVSWFNKLFRKEPSRLSHQSLGYAYRAHSTSFHLAISPRLVSIFRVFCFAPPEAERCPPYDYQPSYRDSQWWHCSFLDSLLSTGAAAAIHHRAPAATVRQHRPPYAKIARLTSISRPCVSYFLPFSATKNTESTNSFSKAGKRELGVVHNHEEQFFDITDLRRRYSSKRDVEHVSMDLSYWSQKRTRGLWTPLPTYARFWFSHESSP